MPLEGGERAGTIHVIAFMSIPIQTCKNLAPGICGIKIRPDQVK